MKKLIINNWYENETIITFTLKVYIIYKAIQNDIFVFFIIFLPIKKSVDAFFSYLEFFLPEFILSYLTYLIFLSILWLKNDEISEHLSQKIETIKYDKSYYNIAYIGLYISVLVSIVKIVPLIIITMVILKI